MHASPTQGKPIRFSPDLSLSHLMYHVYVPFRISILRQGRSSRSSDNNEVPAPSATKTKCGHGKKKGNRRLRQCDYILIRVLADYNASCHTAKRAEKKEDEDETKRMRVCENMVSAWLNDGGSVAT